MLNIGNALQAAAAAGHVDIINLLLEHKPPAIVSAPGGRYGSALMAAICSGSSDTVFALLEEKANPNLRSKVHGRPLERAAYMGHSGKEIVKDLLEFKAEADLSPKGGYVHILHRAATYGMQELASYCLDNGCDIGMRTVKGPRYHLRFGEFPNEMTPLAYACAEGNVGMVRLLLRRGASLERDKDPSAVLWIAAYQGHAEVVDILINKYKQDHSPEATANFIDQRPSPKSGHPILWTACSSSSPETVRVLLDHGAKYESNWYKATPLLTAATFGRPNVAKVLFDYHRQGKFDVCINQRAKNGRTALYEACELNRQRIMEQLLDAGADYTVRDDNDCTPLHAATHHDGLNVLTALYDKAREADGEGALDEFVNARAKSGQTALIHAVDRNKVAHACFLIDRGADYTIAGHLGNNPLHWAARHGNEQICKKMIERAKEDDDQSFHEFLDLVNRDGCTALHLATNEQKILIVQLLLRQGADITIANRHHVTSLHSAVWRSLKDIMVLLLEEAKHQLDAAQFTAFLNHRNDVGTTALMDSVRPLRKQLGMDMTQILLDYGADATIPRDDKVTPLHRACFEGRLDLVHLLLDHTQQKLTPARFTAYMDYRNSVGRTALYDSIRGSGGNGTAEILQLLLDRGADYTISNKNGSTPLHSAAYHGQVGFVQMLLSHSFKNDSPERFQSFLNARNDKGKTALHESCERGRQRITRLLMEHGVDFTLADNEGRTALHWCIPRDQVKTMGVLLECAAIHQSEEWELFINHRRSTTLTTALHDACAKGNDELAFLLLEHGADYKSLDQFETTPLQHAIAGGHEGVAFKILAHALKRHELADVIQMLKEAGQGEGMRKLAELREIEMGKVQRIVKGLEWRSRESFSDDKEAVEKALKK